MCSQFFTGDYRYDEIEEPSLCEGVKLILLVARTSIPLHSTEH